MILSDSHKNPVFHLVRTHQKVTAVFNCDRLAASRYTLQRSLDQAHYETIAVYHPFSGSPEPVKLLDESAPAGNCFYRLKMLDKNGDSHESVVELLPADAAELSVAVSNEQRHKPLLKFDVRNIAAPCEMLVVVYDSLGREMISFGRQLKKAGSFVLMENLADKLSSGVYRVVTAFTDAIFSSTVLVTDSPAALRSV